LLLALALGGAVWLLAVLLLVLLIRRRHLGLITAVCTCGGRIRGLRVLLLMRVLIVIQIFCTRAATPFRS
jgi:hypothetical protein